MGVLLLTACGARPISGTGSTGIPHSATATSTPAQAKLRFRGGASLQTPYISAIVTFVPGTPYTIALRTITDLGLIPRDHCTSAGLAAGIKWQPAGQAAEYGAPVPPPDGPGLWVLGPASYPDPDIPIAPPDWLPRLAALPAVHVIDDGPTNCPLLPGPAGTPSYVPPTTTFTSLHVSFSAATTYDAALEATTNLGFRLADPCYEQAQPKPAWHPMGQEQSFDATHTLILSTTFANSTQWQQQLTAVAGVTAIQTPYTASC
ncbi:MAG TPA: hypothetical protein VKT52_00725 [Ktedonobacterales bacterium]|nr:hypothetical protein [Ktedonobacterales bacterium]